MRGVLGEKYARSSFRSRVMYETFLLSTIMLSSCRQGMPAAVGNIMLSDLVLPSLSAE